MAKQKDDTHFKQGANELHSDEASEAKEDRAVSEPPHKENLLGGYGKHGMKAHMGQAISHLQKEKDCKI